MADPIVHITNGIPDSGTGNITTLGQTLTDGANATLGATTGLAVTTNTTGTIQQYLRGFVSLFSGSIFSGQNQASPANTQLVGAQFNTTPTTVVTGNSSPLQMDSSGNLLVNVKAGGGAGGTSSTFGSAFPATGTASGFSDGVNMQPGTIKAASTAAVGADKAIVVAVSPNNTPVLPSGAATSANQPTNASQGSTTSGQSGTLVQGAVTTGSPTYTTAQTSPLSLDTSGNLRVNVVAGGGAGGTSSTFGSTFPSTGTAVGFTDGTNMVAGRIKPASTAPLPTDPAIVVSISPNSVNANGQNTMINSAPVVLSSNQSTLAVAQDTSQIANGASGTMLTQAAKPATASASGATSVVPLVSAKKIRILSAYITANGAVNFNFQSHITTSNKTGLTYCAAAGDGLVLPFNPMGWFDTTAGEALDINLSGAVAVDGYINYVAV